MNETAVAAVTSRANPYVGPRPLRFGEQLHGRQRELDELRDAVVADRVVLLYSPSGAGKSSLLEAGLRPALEAKGFFVAPTIRVNQDGPGNRYALSAMLSLDEVQPPERRIGRTALAAMTLAEYVSNATLTDLHANRELCLVFDQFEEVFTLDPVDVTVKAAFFTQLGELLRDRGVWAVIAMREDFIAHLDPYLKVFPRRLATRRRLDFLDERSALAAVKMPARELSVEFTEDAARQLVGDLRTVMVTRHGVPTREQGLHVEPVQLQVVCSQLWSRLPADTSTVTAADIEQYADTDNALAHFYADQVEAVAVATGESERTIRDWFEQRLITPHGFRAQAFEFPSDRSLTVLTALEDAYLIRAESRRGVKWYELTHDRMIAPIVESNAEWRSARLNPLQKRAAEWDATQRPVGLLVGGDVLTEAESWIVDSPDATAIERAFIADSRRHEDDAQAELQRHIDETKRARRRSMIFAALAIVAAVGLITAAIATVAARRATSEAESSARAAESFAAEAAESEAKAVDALEQATKSELEAEASETKAVDALAEATRSKREAEARDLAARSTATDTPYDAALLALEAELWTETPVLQSRIAWRDAVDRMARQPAWRSHDQIVTGDGATSAVAWSPDGMMIAAGNADGTMRLVDAVSGETVGDPIVTGAGATLAVVWSGDGMMIVAGNGDGTMRLFDAVSGETVGDPIVTGAGATLAVVWSGDGTSIAAGNGDGTMRLFDAVSGETVGDPIVTGDSPASAVAWSPDGTIIVTGNFDGTMRLFDAVSGETVGDPIVTGAGATLAAVWSGDGTIIAAGNADGTMRLFDAVSGDPVGDPIVTGDSATWAVALSPDGTSIAAGNFDGTMRLFDAVSGAPVGDPIATGNSATSEVTWSPDGMMIATGNADGTMQLFDAVSGDPIGDPIDTGNSSTTAVVWSPDGTVIAAGNFDGTMRLFDAVSGDPVGDPIATGDSPASAVAWSPDGTSIATVNFDGTMQLFDAVSGDPVGDPIATGDSPASAVAWSPDGTIIATGNADGTVRLFDAVSGDPVGDPIGDDPIDTGVSSGSAVGFSASAVAWSLDGTVIATNTFDGTMQLFDAVSGDPIGDPIVTGAGATSAVAWSPDGTIIAAGNFDGTMRLFDAVSGDSVGDPIATGDSATSAVAWSPDGTIIATVNADGTMQLFDAVSGDPIGDPIATGNSSTTAVAWSPDGTIIATGNGDGTMRLLASWSESEACAYLRTLMSTEQMDHLVTIEGGRSKCAHEQVVDLQPIPVLSRPMP